MVSHKAKIEELIGGGPYSYKIHDQIYHGIGTLLPDPGSAPAYAQLYIYDGAAAAEQRMNVPANNKCLPSVMRALTDLINSIKPYAQAFKKDG